MLNESKLVGRGYGVDQKRFKIAIHETGHAVMALLCNQGIKKISLREMDSPMGTDNYLGSTILEPFKQDMKITINEATRRIMISLGGYASEILFFDSANVGGDDLMGAVKRVESLMQSEEFRRVAARLPVPNPGALDLIENSSVRAFIDYQMHLCINKLIPFRELIQLIAEKLCSSEELTGDEVSTIYNSFMCKIWAQPDSFKS